jgi:hypothetical protein
VQRPRSGSTEGKRKNLHAWTHEPDLEPSIGDGLRLSDQLIQPRFRNSTISLGINVNAARSTRWLAIDAHAKAQGHRAHGQALQ